MNSEHPHLPFQSDALEKWLESFFLDPFSTILDQSQFRIDLYDTETEFIIEALLPNYQVNEITIFIEKCKVNIQATKTTLLERTLTFPFPICSQKIIATFHNGIVEIFISKKIQETPISRVIPISE
jgi:HSP20 family molecular chaperone IbpA